MALEPGFRKRMWEPLGKKEQKFLCPGCGKMKPQLGCAIRRVDKMRRRVCASCKGS